MTAAFDGVRILDFTQGVAGPMATMLFADFGADVVKVEPPGGDRIRDHPGYLAWNRNKQRVTLELMSPEGLADAHRLVAGADAVLFDNPPGELERLGLDGVSLVQRYPGLLHAWLPPYAASGRWSQLPPDDLLVHAVTGIAHLQYSFEDVPVALVTPQVAYAHAATAANAIAAGLWERRRSGRGQAVTVTGMDAVAAIESGSAIGAATGVIRPARSSRGGFPHYRLYRCADGKWFFLGCLVAPFFLKALEALDLLHVMALEGIDGEFTNLMKPPGARLAQEILEAKFAEQPREHWMKVLHDAGVPRGPVGIREEWFRSETIAINEMRLELDHPTLGRVEMPGVPVKLSDTPGRVRGFATDTTVDDVAARWTPRDHPPATQAAPASPSPQPGPLAGVRVLDLGAFIAGTFAPTVLANFGADVIKVEPIEGDPFRPYGFLFYGHNLGKRSIAIDLKHPAGRAVFDELVRQSDVVLDNFRLGVRERLGIDYASLSKVNPRIITCSVNAFGTVGPLAADPGFDPLLQARSGMMAAQGGMRAEGVDEEPVFHQLAVNDTATAMMAAFGMQVALHARERTGRGQEVLTCLANQTILFQSGELTWYEGRPPAPLGGRDFPGPTALHRYYACADGWIGLACLRPEQFHATMLAIGRPDLAPRYIAERAMEEPANSPLAEAIAAALAAIPWAEALDRLAVRGVPAARVLRGDEMFDDPWLNEQRFFQDIDDPTWGHIRTVRSYATWSRSTGGFPCRAPLIGEHTLEILREFGIDASRVAALLADGVIAQAG